jgi:uncharacterized membrane protein YvbJ
MNQEYDLSGSSRSSWMSPVSNLPRNQKIALAVVVAIVILVIIYFVYTKWFAKPAATETFMMPTTTMRQQIASFPEAMVSSSQITGDGNVYCNGLDDSNKDTVVDPYAWASSEAHGSDQEPMTARRKTEGDLSKSLMGL